MSHFVAVTDSPVAKDLSIERSVLSGIKVEKVSWQDETSLIEALAEADGVLCMHAPMTARVVRRLPRCRIIATFGTGLDNIDVDAARAENIFVSGVSDYCTEEVANHTIALILAWNRKLFPCPQVRNGEALERTHPDHWKLGFHAHPALV